MREIRDAQVAGARERVFGPQKDMPGDRYFKKPLEGREIGRWYFPSKYSMQDFRVDEYFEMQAERLAPRKVHQSIHAVQQMLEDVSKRREQLQRFFGQIDEKTFRDNPSLQDLYGLYRMVDEERALKFEPPAHVFSEHAPWQVQSPGLIMHELQEKLGRAEAVKVTDRIMRMQSMDDVEADLRKLCKTHHIVPNILGMSVQLDWDAEVHYVASHTPAERVGANAASDVFQDTHPQKAGAKLELHFEPRRAPVRAVPSAVKVTDPGAKAYLARRHRFIDPMYRRRRLKWLERQKAKKNNETEVKFNDYYATHPDNHKVWPTNKGSVTVVWPSPYH